MSFRVPQSSRLRAELGAVGVDFLEHGLESLTRILPHVETKSWRITRGASASGATFADVNRRQLNVKAGLDLGGSTWTIFGVLQRRKVPQGVGSIERTISLREKDVSQRVMTAVAATLGTPDDSGALSLRALRASFDERVVAEHLAAQYALDVDLGEWFIALRQLAEQTYENKALALGCIIDSKKTKRPREAGRFPRDFLKRKKYRALSDGYRTGYLISGAGAFLGFKELGRDARQGSQYYPEWCEDLASEARSGRIALALTRHGDVLVLENGQLTFTYRFGRWQHWNHTHLVDLIRNAARVQRVPTQLLSAVVRSVYRVALDISFRKSGGMFVLLRRRASLHDIVRWGDAVGDPERDAVDAEFDRSVGKATVQSTRRTVLAELASLDGALVLSNKGQVLAYGAILEPKKRGRIAATEGSRSKAAIGASNYGLAVKVSSDGDITVYVGGTKLIQV